MAVEFYAPEVEEGEFVGEYQVIEPLGRGPTGMCYRVVSNVMGKEFALKTVRLTEGLSIDWRDRLEAQGGLLSKLSHKNIDRVLRSGKWGEFWFSVKDYVHNGEGESWDLERYLLRHGGRLSVYQVWHILKQLALALQGAEQYQDLHHSGVAHGNLKPRNVLIGFGLDGEGSCFEVKLTDFQPYGLWGEKQLLEVYGHWWKGLRGYPDRLREKATHHALESLYSPLDFCAPEQKLGGFPRRSGDIFSLGLLTYWMFTGGVPQGRFAPLHTLREELGEPWDTFVETCLQAHPDLRYGSYAELLEALDHLAPEEASKEEEEERVSPSLPKERHFLTPKGMVFVPAASFLVGSEECGQDAYPPHEVESKGFYMDRSPVTNRQFEQFVRETGYVTEAERGEGAPIWLNGEWCVLEGISWRQPSSQKHPVDFADHPVTQVSYEDALAYCKWAGKRLPTEGEWEYAARGGLSQVRYPWGDQIGSHRANFSSEGTTATLRYPANGYGLHDMAGNVWEWTASWYQPYPGNHSENPHFGEVYRVVRGGAWMYDSDHCLVSYRNANQPSRCYPTVGFRTVCDFS